jgi:hypothetical protein
MRGKMLRAVAMMVVAVQCLWRVSWVGVGVGAVDPWPTQECVPPNITSAGGRVAGDFISYQKIWALSENPAYPPTSFINTAYECMYPGSSSYVYYFFNQPSFISPDITIISFFSYAIRPGTPKRLIEMWGTTSEARAFNTPISAPSAAFEPRNYQDSSIVIDVRLWQRNDANGYAGQFSTPPEDVVDYAVWVDCNQDWIAHSPDNHTIIPIPYIDSEGPTFTSCTATIWDNGYGALVLSNVTVEAVDTCGKNGPGQQYPLTAYGTPLGLGDQVLCGFTEGLGWADLYGPQYGALRSDTPQSTSGFGTVDSIIYQGNTFTAPNKTIVLQENANNFFQMNVIGTRLVACQVLLPEGQPPLQGILSWHIASNTSLTYRVVHNDTALPYRYSDTGGDTNRERNAHGGPGDPQDDGYCQFNFVWFANATEKLEFQVHFLMRTRSGPAPNLATMTFLPCEPPIAPVNRSAKVPERIITRICVDPPDSDPVFDRFILQSIPTRGSVHLLINNVAELDDEDYQETPLNVWDLPYTITNPLIGSCFAYKSDAGYQAAAASRTYVDGLPDQDVIGTELVRYTMSRFGTCNFTISAFVHLQVVYPILFTEGLTQVYDEHSYPTNREFKKYGFTFEKYQAPEIVDIQVRFENPHETLIPITVYDYVLHRIPTTRPMEFTNQLILIPWMQPLTIDLMSVLRYRLEMFDNNCRRNVSEGGHYDSFVLQIASSDGDYSAPTVINIDVNSVSNNGTISLLPGWDDLVYDNYGRDVADTPIYFRWDDPYDECTNARDQPYVLLILSVEDLRPTTFNDAGGGMQCNYSGFTVHNSRTFSDSLGRIFALFYWFPYYEVNNFLRSCMIDTKYTGEDGPFVNITIIENALQSTMDELSPNGNFQGYSENSYYIRFDIERVDRELQESLNSGEGDSIVITILTTVYILIGAGVFFLIISICLACYTTLQSSGVNEKDTGGDEDNATLGVTQNAGYGLSVRGPNHVCNKRNCTKCLTVFFRLFAFMTCFPVVICCMCSKKCCNFTYHYLCDSCGADQDEPDDFNPAEAAPLWIGRTAY